MRASTQRKRIQQIVDDVFDGNVKAAAEAAGVQQPTLHRIIRGEIREPRMSMMERLADRYGVSLAWIVGESDQPAPEGSSNGHLAHQLATALKLDEVRTPLWWDLIANYHRRAQRDDRAYIDAVRPRAANGQRILSEYMRSKRLDRNKILFFACLQPFVESREKIPKNFLLVWRAEWERETALVRLVAAQLKRLGEIAD